MVGDRNMPGSTIGLTGIQVKYGEVWGDLHGEWGDDYFEAVLPEGEQIWSVQGMSDFRMQGPPDNIMTSMWIMVARWL